MLLSEETLTRLLQLPRTHLFSDYCFYVQKYGVNERIRGIVKHLIETWWYNASSTFDKSTTHILVWYEPTTPLDLVIDIKPVQNVNRKSWDELVSTALWNRFDLVRFFARLDDDEGEAKPGHPLVLRTEWVVECVEQQRYLWGNRSNGWEVRGTHNPSVFRSGTTLPPKSRNPPSRPDKIPLSARIAPLALARASDEEKPVERKVTPWQPNKTAAPTPSASQSRSLSDRLAGPGAPRTSVHTPVDTLPLMPTSPSSTSRPVKALPGRAQMSSVNDDRSETTTNGPALPRPANKMQAPGATTDKRGQDPPIANTTRTAINHSGPTGPKGLAGFHLPLRPPSPTGLSMHPIKRKIQCHPWTRRIWRRVALRADQATMYKERADILPSRLSPSPSISTSLSNTTSTLPRARMSITPATPIFTNPSGLPMSFYIVPDRAGLQYALEIIVPIYGGKVVRPEKADLVILLLPPGHTSPAAISIPDVDLSDAVLVSHEYIRDCIKEGRILHVGAYRIRVDDNAVKLEEIADRP